MVRPRLITISHVKMVMCTPLAALHTTLCVSSRHVSPGPSAQCAMGKHLVVTWHGHVWYYTKCKGSHVRLQQPHCTLPHCECPAGMSHQVPVHSAQWVVTWYGHIWYYTTCRQPCAPTTTATAALHVSVQRACLTRSQRALHRWERGNHRLFVKRKVAGK